MERLRGEHKVGRGDVGLEAQQLAGELRQPLYPIAAPAHFHAVVLSLAVAQFSQSLAQGLQARTGRALRSMEQHHDQRHARLRGSTTGGKSGA